MAAAVAFGATPQAFKVVAVNLTGFTAATGYICTVTDPTGGVTKIGPLTTDGSGNVSFKYTPQGQGSVTVDVRPAAEHTGTTSATATTGAVSCTGGFK